MRLTSCWRLMCAAVLVLTLPQVLMAGEVSAPASEQKAEVATQPAAAAPVIRAGRFELVDNQGTVRAVLGTDAEGTVGVHVYDQVSGKERLSMGLSSVDGEPFLMLLGSGGDVKVALGVSKEWETGVLFIPGFSEAVTARQLLSNEPLTNVSGSCLMGGLLHLAGGSSGAMIMSVYNSPTLDLIDLDQEHHSSLSAQGLEVGTGKSHPGHQRAMVGLDKWGKSILTLSSPSGLATTTLTNPEEPTSEWAVLASAYGDATSVVAGDLKDFDLDCELSVLQREASVFFRLSSDTRETEGMRTDGLNGYGVIFAPFADQGANPGLYLVKRVDGVEETLAFNGEGFPRRDGHASLVIRAQGSTLTVLESGLEVLKADDGQFSEGKLVWRVYGDQAHPARAGFRTESLSPSGTQEPK